MPVLKPLPRTTPESVGLPNESVHAFLDELEQKALAIHSFMIIRDGKVAAEGWWEPFGADIPHFIFSITKSFTSTAVGLAVQEGLLTVEDKVASYFPEEMPEQPSERLLAMRVRDLLAMASGHSGDPTEAAIQEGRDWIRAFLHAPLDYAPGEHFTYSSGATHMLGLIVEKASGERLEQYLAPRIFEPLGIQVDYWMTLPEGNVAGGWGLCLRLEDVAKLGLLYLQRGIWEGERLLDENWIEASAALQVPNGTEENSDWSTGYGYQLWRCRFGAYRFAGLFTQKCVIIPQCNTIVALNCAEWREQDVLNAIWNHLLPVLSNPDHPLLQQQENVSRALQARLSGLKLGEPHNLSHQSPAGIEWHGRTFQLSANSARWESIALHEQQGKLIVTVEQEGSRLQHEYGLGEWAHQGDGMAHLAGLAGWTDEGVLSLLQYEVQTPFNRQVMIKFTGAQIELRMKRNLAWPTGNWFDEDVTVEGQAR
ncbi:serine hydrolase domain-containing protein [Paenibacillus sp. MMS18-CY102]|uniref:serine hydrolase domain-containing protein n=1 Tax=Paenibacillus sp. MMS18-CY102 TaxID=2682849 RepID=UPI0013663D17|nr:serine hydrolase [Paenibacillus sp. MMS18-CY102]MWC27957.1 serine hydrolase [Paenibacillus sp. MMS18-CY102]